MAYVRDESHFPFFFSFSLPASAGLVRTMGHALHNTKTIATFAFANEDTQENTAKFLV